VGLIETLEVDQRTKTLRL